MERRQTSTSADAMRALQQRRLESAQVTKSISVILKLYWMPGSSYTVEPLLMDIPYKGHNMNNLHI